MARAISNSISFDELESLFHQKKFAPIYFFYGEEILLIDDAVDFLISEALSDSERAFNLDIFYGGEIDSKSVVSAASSYPMTSARRIVIVKDFDRLVNKEYLIPYLDDPSDSTSLVLISQKPDFRLKVYTKLKEKAINFQSNPLKDDEIPLWISKRIEKLDKKATYQAAQLLQAHVGKSLRDIQNEIEKLFIYIGDRKSIDVDDVSAVVGISKKYNIFELQKAIGQKNLAHSVEILENMLKRGEKSVGIIAFLTNYYQKISIAKELIAQRKSQQDVSNIFSKHLKQKYYIDELLQTARRYTEEELETVFRTLSDTDEQLKTSSQDEKLAMTVMLYKIIAKAGAVGQT